MFFASGATTAPRPLRIASCAIASDEMLVDLLGRAGHPERLVAVSTLADDTRYSNLVPVPAGISGRCGGELESLLKLKPDVAVIASFNRPELIARLKAAGVIVHTLGDFTTLNDVETNLRALGELIREPEATKAAVSAFVAERDRLTAKPSPAAVAPVRALEFFPDGVVSGRETLFDDLVRHAGGINVAAEMGLKGWPRVSTETLATLRPDVIIAGGDPAEQPATLARLRSIPGFKEMSAVKQGRLVMIPQREMSAASPHILKALTRISTALKDARP